MTSRIKIVHQSLISSIESILVDGLPLIKYFNIWNEQIEKILKETNEGYEFNFPACFIEFDPGIGANLAKGVTAYPDCKIGLHIAHWLLNSSNMDMNLDIFDVRDPIKHIMIGKNIPYCSNLQLDEDKLDFSHDAVYVYLLTFRTHFTDTKGSIYDVDSGKIIHTLSGADVINNQQLVK